MEASKKHLFSRLYERVISAQHQCIGCGACVLVCPFDRLEYKDGRPRQTLDGPSVCPVSEEGKCGLCAQVCPRFSPTATTFSTSTQRPAAESPATESPAKSQAKSSAEAEAGPSQTAPIYGAYKRIDVAKSTDPVLQEKGQDSGLVSALAAWGLESGKWPRFLAYSRDELWHPYPEVVTESGAITRTCGSKYTYVSLIEGLSELRDQAEKHQAGKRAREKPDNSEYTGEKPDSSERAREKQGGEAGPVAVVGLPCHIAAIRKLQQMNSKYVKNIELCIGLFCSKAFTYEGLVEGKLAGEMGLSLTDIEKMDIRKGRFTVEMQSGEVHEVPLKELGGCAHGGCAACEDFAAEQADISVGGLGIGGWTLAITRTDIGEAVMEAARKAGSLETTDKDNFPKALGLLEKLSAMKQKNAAKWKSEKNP